jgi:carbamate kinase
MRVVIALGGNALASAASDESLDRQRERVAEAASAVADIARANEVVITHGNGPQIGLLAAQARAMPGAVEPSLDLLGAETEGMLGYWFESALSEIFPSSEIATMLTQVEVADDDPAFVHPTKPIGPFLSREDAASLRERHGFAFEEFGQGFRRVVPSPHPVRIREAHAIRRLVDAGVVVVCAGGGGIPVVRTADGGLRGADAVIDKDLTAAVLAEQIEADRLLLLTNVDAVYADWPEPCRDPIRRIHPDAFAGLDLEAGTMGPKVEAAIRFARGEGRVACIGALDDARRVFEGAAGTWVSKAVARTSG